MAYYIPEVVAELTTKEIISAVTKFIGKEASKKVIGWVTGTAMDKLFGDKSDKSINDTLIRIEENQTRILSKLEGALCELRWEHLNSRIFEAEEDICHKFQLLKTIMSNEIKSERFNEGKRLQDGILDTNRGILYDLAIVNRVLLGRSMTSPGEKGLLEMWSEGQYDKMVKSPVSAKLYHENVLYYLHKSAVLQLKGIILFLSACENQSFCHDQLTMMYKRLEKQNDVMLATLPKSVKHLINPTGQELFELYPAGNDRCVYGPPVGGQERTHELRLRPRNINNEDEEWIFEKSSESHAWNGSLLISQRSKKFHRCGYLRISGNEIHCDAKKQNANAFYVMPRHSKYGKMRIVISSVTQNNFRFLNNHLQITQNTEATEFVMMQTFHPDD